MGTLSPYSFSNSSFSVWDYFLLLYTSNIAIPSWNVCWSKRRVELQTLLLLQLPPTHIFSYWEQWKKKKKQYNSLFLTPSKASNSMTYVWNGPPQNVSSGEETLELKWAANSQFAIIHWLDWMVNRSLTKMCLSWFKVIFLNISVIDYYMSSVSVISNSKSRVDKIRKELKVGSVV